jgi:hypothetical protein
MLEVEWRHDKRRLVIPVSILAPLPAKNLAGLVGQALIDTGSTTSGITKAVASELALVGRGKRPLGSAQGEGQAERYLFRIGITAGLIGASGRRFPFVFEEVMGFELANSFQFEALLGMDILSQCDLSIDRDRRCSLRFG